MPCFHSDPEWDEDAPPLPARNYSWSDIEDNDDEVLQSDDDLDDDEPIDRMSIVEHQKLYSSVSTSSCMPPHACLLVHASSCMPPRACLLVHASVARLSQNSTVMKQFQCCSLISSSGSFWSKFCWCSSNTGLKSRTKDKLLIFGTHSLRPKP